MADEEKIELTPKQKLFCEEYVRQMFNGTQAAIKAGYSETGAREIASENLTKPAVKAEIERILISKQLGKEQTAKMVADMAQSSITDYMKPVVSYVTPRIRVGLDEAIKRLRIDIEDDEEYALRVDLDEEESKKLAATQKARERRIRKLEIQLERDPFATVIVDGPVEEVTTMVVDLVKLAADKERGRIKSYKMGKHGPEVELYGADGALRDLVRIHGLYAPEKKEHSGEVAIGAKLTPEEFSNLINKLDGK